jgi:hypothetical protein
MFGCIFRSLSNGTIARMAREEADKPEKKGILHAILSIDTID